MNIFDKDLFNIKSSYTIDEIDYCKSIENLLINGANIEASTGDLLKPTCIFLITENIKLLELFIIYKSNLNIENADGETLLYYACAIPNYNDGVKLLLDNGALANTSNCHPLYISVSKKNISLTKLLKEHNANFNGDIYNPSVLHVAVAANSLKMVKEILTWDNLIIDWDFVQNNKNIMHRIALNKS